VNFGKFIEKTVGLTILSVGLKNCWPMKLSARLPKSHAEYCPAARSRLRWGCPVNESQFRFVVMIILEVIILCGIRRT
jgi:hypothetical protein